MKALLAIWTCAASCVMALAPAQADMLHETITAVEVEDDVWDTSRLLVLHFAYRTRRLGRPTECSVSTSVESGLDCMPPKDSFFGSRNYTTNVLNCAVTERGSDYYRLEVTTSNALADAAVHQLLVRNEPGARSQIKEYRATVSKTVAGKPTLSQYKAFPPRKSRVTGFVNCRQYHPPFFPFPRDL